MSLNLDRIYKNEEVWEFQIREDGTVEGEQEKILEIENHHTRIHGYTRRLERKQGKRNYCRRGTYYLRYSQF